MTKPGTRTSKEIGRIMFGHRKAAPYTTCLIPDYGRKKLSEYAETYRELAGDLCRLNSERPSGYDRTEYLHRVRLKENREIFAGHLKELAERMESLAMQEIACSRPQPAIAAKMSSLLKEHGITLREIWYLHLDEGVQVCLTMKGSREGDYTTEEIAVALSECLKKKYVPSAKDNLFVAYEYDTYFFEEEPAYVVVKGIARAVKSTETISGDSYAFFYSRAGRFCSVLSDGVGSGENAAADSGNVVEMAERFLRAGFSGKEAAAFINGTIAADDREQNMPTLDLLEMNLHTGACSILKVGAADSYHKHLNSVHVVQNDALPLGFTGRSEWHEECLQVNEGDYLIMMSDGVSESLDDNMTVEEMIRNISYQNPSEIADFLLRFAIGREQAVIKDDLTVIVIGMWKRY